MMCMRKEAFIVEEQLLRNSGKSVLEMWWKKILIFCENHVGGNYITS